MSSTPILQKTLTGGKIEGTATVTPAALEVNFSPSTKASNPYLTSLLCIKQIATQTSMSLPFGLVRSPPWPHTVRRLIRLRLFFAVPGAFGPLVLLMASAAPHKLPHRQPSRYILASSNDDFSGVR